MIIEPNPALVERARCAALSGKRTWADFVASLSKHGRAQLGDQLMTTLASIADYASDWPPEDT